MWRKFPVLFSSILCVFVCAGQAVAATLLGQEEPYVPAFNSAPPLNATVTGPAVVTVTLAGISYKASKEVAWPTFPQFANLDKALRDELTRVFAGKGFGIRGPFDSYDLIPYADKKEIDLFVVPGLEMYVTLKDQKEEVESIWSAPPVYNLTGNVEVKGKLTLEMKEVATKELMWVKSIPIAFSFPYSLRVEAYVPSGYGNSTPFDYGWIMNGVAKGLEQQYPEMMATFDKLIDPQEMRGIRKQCQELKQKRGY